MHFNRYFVYLYTQARRFVLKYIGAFFLCLALVSSAGGVFASDVEEVSGSTGTIYATWWKTPFEAVVADTPEAWNGRFVSPPETGQGILFVFTSEAYHVIDCSVIPFACDILFITRNSRIQSLLEGCNPQTLAAPPEPCVAALCMPAGFVRDHNLEPALAVDYPRSVRLRAGETSDPEHRETVIQQLSDNLARHPDCTACRISLAGMLLEHMDYSMCESVLQPLMDAGEVPLEATIILAKAVALQGRFDASLNLFSSALEQAPHRESTAIFIERTLRVSRPKNDVIELLHELLDRHPDNPHLIRILCRNYLAANRLDDARRLIRQKLKDMPELPDLWRIAGDVYLRSGDHAAAADAYQKYIEAGPLDPRIREIHSFVIVHKYRKQLPAGNKNTTVMP